MNQKNHARAPDKVGFSVALPKKLLGDIQTIADSEHRTRNKQIEHFLHESVMRWKAAQQEDEVMAAAEDPAPYGVSPEILIAAERARRQRPPVAQAPTPAEPAKDKAGKS